MRQAAAASPGAVSLAKAENATLSGAVVAAAELFQISNIEYAVMAIAENLRGPAVGQPSAADARR
ncbi:hypothetical protein [Bosea sp. CRIB-10]|uniref:hypothetical protein n=1 Tax=Bosea sp. CRIB-10 TaxID=378404 RepID=UPI000B84602E|nr:hypothetical protein [Bosea sp. CRIB-10]